MACEQSSSTTSFECSVITGTEDESALDIGQLRAKTGLVALDPAFMNTAAVKSQITFLDGEKGVLRYRGIPIEQLAERSTFVETSYLLVYGNLPTKPELEKFLRLNADFAKIWPNITTKKEPPADGKAWEDVPNKLTEQFSPNPGTGD